MACSSENMKIFLSRKLVYYPTIVRRKIRSSSYSLDYVAFPPLYEHFSAFQLDSLFRWPYVHPVNQPRFVCERLVYIAARTDSIQWTISGHSTISLSIAVLIRLVWFDLSGVMQYIFVYILWGVHFKLRMLSLGVMLYILIYVCISLDSLQGLICLCSLNLFHYCSYWMFI